MRKVKHNSKLICRGLHYERHLDELLLAEVLL